MDLIIWFLFVSLTGQEWMETKDAEGTLFTSVYGLGAFRSLSIRSYQPSLVYLIYGLLVLAGGVQLAVERYWLATLAGVTLVLLGMYIVYWRAQRWPGRTPRRAALFACGIAWEEQGQVRQLDWRQIVSARVDRHYYRVRTGDGREIIFDAGLRNQPLGASLEAALTGEPDPNRPVNLMRCPHCGETISADSSRCLFCMEKIG